MDRQASFSSRSLTPRTWIYRMIFQTSLLDSIRLRSSFLSKLMTVEFFRVGRVLSPSIIHQRTRVSPSTTSTSTSGRT